MPQKEPNIYPEEEIKKIHNLVSAALIKEKIPSEKITNGDIRAQSVLYMIYWFHRLRNNPEEQSRIRQNLIEYIGDTVSNPGGLADLIFADNNLKDSAKKYVETLLVPTRTVDLVITKIGEKTKTKEVLCIERTYYPFGLALPGGIIKDSDENNKLDLPPEVFAALRVAGEKVLGIGEKAQYSREINTKDKASYSVRGEKSIPTIRIYPEDEGGFHFRENIKSVLRPSDPRHIVDTVGFKCELEGEAAPGLVWRDREKIMSPDEPTGGFAFGHHREIVTQIISQTSVVKERELKEREFIRSLINDPLGSYTKFKKRFDEDKNPQDASFPELFPVVDKMLTEVFSDDINKMCEEIPLLAGVRDKAVISLRQVALKNRTFCPYLPTIHAIAEGVAFFDIVARQKKGFYNTMPKDKIVEHNPAKTPYASYHMYRYKYRFDELLSMTPGEILIPTYEPLSAIDLMKIRGVPIRFLGITHDFLYVDEFEQSPEEFFMHDCNHTWRMVMEDKKAEEKYGKTREAMFKESNIFINEYLNKIKVTEIDTEIEREKKKLKKIILFEIVHEDARPFLKEVVCRFIQLKEGSPVPFEVPRIDKETGYMDIVDEMDTGISTLSYVRNKLQHGFYDHVDAQVPQIVDPKYRTAEWITKAAYDMLVELKAEPVKGAELDSNGNVSYEWLLRRTCAVGPDNIHGEENIDPTVEKYGDGAEKLNPKRYQVGV